MLDPRTGDTSRPYSKAWQKPSTSSSKDKQKPAKEEKGKSGKGLKIKNPSKTAEKPSSKRPRAEEAAEVKGIGGLLNVAIPLLHPAVLFSI